MTPGKCKKFVITRTHTLDIREFDDLSIAEEPVLKGMVRIDLILSVRQYAFLSDYACRS